MLPVAMAKEEKRGASLMSTSLFSAPFRVQFRADMLQQRREDRDMRELERQTEEQERQNRLEALRKQVNQ